MTRLLLVWLCFLLAGCAAGGAVDYMKSEYGNVQRDGVINMSDDPNYPLEYQIWLHKTKPKINVQTSISMAGGVGFNRGFGIADNAPVQPTFEKVALRYLNENKGTDCRLSNPVKLADVAWEFDYNCDPSIPFRKPATKR